jgi:peptidoglycan/xylan/chitin deacetylase (PgdA/CDA1 family)
VDNGYVGLTFDDGPHAESTTALLDVLAAAQATATFFVCGEHVRRYPQHARAVSDAGMPLGNHSFSHDDLTRLAPEAVADDLARTQQAVFEACDQVPVLFRPPYGETDDGVRAVAAGLGMTEVLWTVDPRDWSGVDTKQILETAVTVEPGGIILLHDGGYPSTLEAVPLILRALADRGLSTGRIVAAPPDRAGGAVRVVAP